jgi:multiple sugar transport system substrate-binding protein
MTMLDIIGPNDPALDALDAALARRPELNARLRIIPWPDYQRTLMAGLTAAESPWQAAFIPGHIWLPDLASRGLLAPLELLLEEIPEAVRARYDAGDILPAVAAECRYEDREYLLPLFTDGHILFYLEKCFDFPVDEAAGAPIVSTREIAALAQKAHHPPKHHGLALKADVSEIFTDWLPYLWEAGGRIFDDAGRPDIANPVNIDSLAYYCSLQEVCPPQTARYGNAEIAKVIQKEEAALVATWGGQAAPLFREGATGYRAAIFPEPWNATWGVGVPANQPIEVQQQALAALMQAMGPDTDAAIITTAGSPVRASSYTPEALARYPWLAAQRAMLARARPLPADPRLGLFLGDLYEYVHRAFTGEMTPAAALQAVQSKAERAIAAV